VLGDGLFPEEGPELGEAVGLLDGNAVVMPWLEFSGNAPLSTTIPITMAAIRMRALRVEVATEMYQLLLVGGS